MKNHGKFIAAVLILIVCSPPDGVQVDPSIDMVRTIPVLSIRTDTLPRIALSDSTGDTGHRQKVRRDQRSITMLNYSSEPLEESERTALERQESRDQQTDILEKLLLDSTGSRARPPRKIEKL